MVFHNHVKFGLKNTVLKCATRREFLNKLRRFCELNNDEIVMYDVSTGLRREITVNDLVDNMKIEVEKKYYVLGASKANGMRNETSEIEEYIKPPDKDLLIKKFRENNTLTGYERKFLIKFMEKNYDGVTLNSKRIREGDPPETSNKKVQVFTEQLTQLKSTQTQTDEWIRNDPKSSKSSSSSDLNYKAKRLALEAKKDVSKVDEIMNDTFDERRNFILMQNPVVRLVREKYPLLFSLSEVRNELNRIFYPNKDEEFLANIKKYSEVILSLVDEDDPLLNIIKGKIRTALTPVQKKYTTEVGALLMVSNILNEKRMFLNTEDESWPENNYPRIEAPCKVNRLFHDTQTYKIIVEGLTLCEATDFPEAMLCLMASFFIFNISYPETVFNTLVVFEKIFLEANDTDGNEIDDQTSQIIKLIQLKTTSKFSL